MTKHDDENALWNNLTEWFLFKIIEERKEEEKEARKLINKKQHQRKKRPNGSTFTDRKKLHGTFTISTGDRGDEKGRFNPLPLSLKDRE